VWPGFAEDGRQMPGAVGRPPGEDPLVDDGGQQHAREGGEEDVAGAALNAVHPAVAMASVASNSSSA